METFLLEVSTKVLWIITGAALGIYFIASLVLKHHWDNYGFNPKTITQYKKTYYAITGTLLFLMVLSAIFFSL